MTPEFIMKNYKLVVYVPVTHTDVVRKAIGDAGAGKFPSYTFCSFSSKGIGRFIPQPGASPAIGEIGKMEAVEEERIETLCPAEIVKDVLAAVRNVHPYEEIAYDIYPVEDI